MELEDIEAKLIDIESEIANRASESDVSDLADKISEIQGEISSMSDSLENLFLLALCMVGCFFGWKRVLQAMFLFLAFNMLILDQSLGDNKKTAYLFVFLSVLGGVRWLFKKVRKRFSKGDAPETFQPSEPDSEQSSSSVQRVLARTSR